MGVEPIPGHYHTTFLALYGRAEGLYDPVFYALSYAFLLSDVDVDVYLLRCVLGVKAHTLSGRPS